MRPLLCQLKALSSGSVSQTTIRPEAKMSSCPSASKKWKKIGNHCYIVTNETVAGPTAPGNCPSRYPGSHLAKIDSYDELLKLREFLNSTNHIGNHGVWVNKKLFYNFYCL
jgi:hypothetical protein